MDSHAQWLEQGSVVRNQSPKSELETEARCQSQESEQKLGIRAKGEELVTWSEARLSRAGEQVGTAAIAAVGKCFGQLLTCCCWA